MCTHDDAELGIHTNCNGMYRIMRVATRCVPYVDMVYSSIRLGLRDSEHSPCFEPSGAFLQERPFVLSLHINHCTAGKITGV